MKVIQGEYILTEKRKVTILYNFIKCENNHVKDLYVGFFFFFFFFFFVQCDKLNYGTF